MLRNRMAAVAVLCLAAPLAGCSTITVKSDVPVAERLDKARTLYGEQRLDQAAKIFRELSNRSRYDDATAEEATFYLGECYYRKQDHVKALDAYRALLNEFRTVRYFNEAIRRQFAIGAAFCLGNISTTWHGRGYGAKILAEALDHQVFGEYSAQARMLIGNYNFDKRNYDEALIQYELLVSEYSDTPEAVQARYRKALCLYNMVEGNGYDPAEIEEAIKEFEAARLAASQQSDARANRERLDDIREKLADLQETGARETFDLARFFLKNGNKKAAATYFYQVIEEAPGTQYAQEARRQLQVIQQELN